jgi:alpha-beta hydrolase superfamily lysophospholipase
MSSEELVDSAYESSFIDFPSFVEQNWLPLVSADGIPLATYRIKSENPRALLFYFHGYLSYSLEYIQIGLEMAKEGFECLALDHRGHGKSGGLTGYFTSLDHLVLDATDYVIKVKEVYGDLPVFLAGASMGGAISINVAARVPSSGMALLAPALGTYLQFNCCLTSILNCFVCCCPRRFLPHIGERPVASRNTLALEAFKSSPYCAFGKTRGITVKSLIEGMERTFELARSTRTPFVIVQGGSDFITSAPRANLFFQTAEVKDKSYWLFPDMHHCVQIEPEFEEILAKLKEWFVSRVN